MPASGPAQVLTPNYRVYQGLQRASGCGQIWRSVLDMSLQLNAATRTRAAKGAYIR